MDSYLSESKLHVLVQRKVFDFPLKILYENRYCNQDDFSILAFGGFNAGSREIVNSDYKLCGRKLKCEKYTCMQTKLYNCKTAVLNSDLFAFGGYKHYGEFDSCVRKFCSKTKTW